MRPQKAPATIIATMDQGKSKITPRTTPYRLSIIFDLRRSANSVYNLAMTFSSSSSVRGMG